MYCKEEFDNAWASVVKDLIIKSSKELNIKHKNIKCVEKALRKQYYKQRQCFINTYMVPNTDKIDRHKIASCFVKSILYVKPLYIPVKIKAKFLFGKKKIRELVNTVASESHVVMSNEYLALSVATSILDGYVSSDNREGRFKHETILPNPFPEDDNNYLLDVCIDLYYSGANRFNLATFANVLFLLEKYSCRKTQCDNLEIYCRKNFLGPNSDYSEDDINRCLKSIRYGEYRA